VSDQTRRETARVAITEARPQDATLVAELFLAAFRDSARAMFGERPFRPDAMADFYSYIIRTEPGCTLVAWAPGTDSGEKVVGYITASRDMPRVWSRLLVSGVWLPWLWRYFTGRYGLARGAGPRLLRTQRAFAESARLPETPRASVLSLGVAPSSQGQVSAAPSCGPGSTTSAGTAWPGSSSRSSGITSRLDSSTRARASGIAARCLLGRGPGS